MPDDDDPQESNPDSPPPDDPPVSDPSLDASEDNPLTADDVATNPSAMEPSARQRLRITVPSVLTTMWMGAEGTVDQCRTDDVGEPNYFGFGVHTEGHVYLSAAGDIVNSSATLQATSDVLIQSQDAQILVGAGTNTVIHSVDQTIINGGDGLFLVSGADKTKPVNDIPDARVPDTAKSWYGAVQPAARKVADWWGNIDMWAAGLDLALLAWGTYKDHQSKSLTWKSGLFNLVNGAVVEFGGGGTLDMVGAGSVWVPAKANGNTIIHGEGGLVMGTPKQAALFSTFGTTIGSATFAGVVSPYSSLLGLRDAEVLALTGECSIGARKSVAVTAGQALELSSKTSSVSVAGKDITIGAEAGAGGQAGTENVTVDSQNVLLRGKLSLSIDSEAAATLAAKQNISLTSHEAVASVSGKSATVNGTDDATVSSDKKAGLRSGSFLAYVTPDKVVLGKAPGSLPARPAPPTFPKYPKKPNSKKQKILDAYGEEKRAVAKKRKEMNEEYEGKIKSWKNDVAAMKDASCGVIIKDSKIDLVVSGHRLTLDGSTVKHPSLKILK